jgi:hypothetical protein
MRRRDSHILWTMDSTESSEVVSLSAGRPMYQGRFLVLISLRGRVDPRAMVRLKGLSHPKNPMASSGNEPVTFRLIAEYLNLLRYTVHSCV